MQHIMREESGGAVGGRGGEGWWEAGRGGVERQEERQCAAEIAAVLVRGAGEADHEAGRRWWCGQGVIRGR